MNDIEKKKAFLYQGALLYNKLISFAPNDTIKRYLAFRIIVDTMSFEEIVGNVFPSRVRQIRNTLLAHKQNPEFFAGFNATDEIRGTTIFSLFEFMRIYLDTSQQTPSIPELSNPSVFIRLEDLVKDLLEKYNRDHIDGFRVTNNFLCFTGSQIHEISNNDIAGCFFRYNSSKALFIFAQYLFDILWLDSDFEIVTRHLKRDIILHAINMADCIYKDTRNRYSIDGLYQIMQRENIGNTESLDILAEDTEFNTLYQELRGIRNKFIGHMDMGIPLTNLVEQLDALPIEKVYMLINKVDFATHKAASSDIAIWVRYSTSNSRLREDRQLKIIDIPGLKPTPYCVD